MEAFIPLFEKDPIFEMQSRKLLVRMKNDLFLIRFSEGDKGKNRKTERKRANKIKKPMKEFCEE